MTNNPNTTTINATNTQFKALHSKAEPLVLINIWDAASARIVEALGAKALATSSASLAWSMGYADGYKLPEKELLDAVARIQRVIRIPLSIDIENGYSHNADDVVALVRRLDELDVKGINIEDGSESPEQLAGKIKEIKSAVPHLFINARTDVYLTDMVNKETIHRETVNQETIQIATVNKEITNQETAHKDKQFHETLNRLTLYKAAGADGIFIPGMTDESLLQNLQHQLKIPVNVMVADEKAITSFKDLGVERISVGPISFINAYQTLANTSHSIQTNTGTPVPTLSYEYLNQALIQC